MAEQRPLGSWVDFAPAFSGSAVHATSLDLTAADLADRRLVLDLDDVREIATVNGTELPTALWKPYVVDVTTALRAGTNSIEVRVTNTLANERNQKIASGVRPGVMRGSERGVVARAVQPGRRAGHRCR